VSVWNALRRSFDGRRRLAKVAINLPPRTTPYGGGNQFVRLLQRDLEQHGYEIAFRLDDDADAVLVIDGRRELTTFDADAIAGLKKRRPSLVCIHRVNECDQRKGTQFMDELLARTNGVADHTVFISAWLRDYHAARWFDPARPHSVILNGADARVFHPLRAQALPDRPFRVATHHWSDHALKGFDAYAELDRAVARGALPGIEFWVIGRWPAGLKWEAARLFPPCNGPALADRLRECHAYVTASRWEPGGMHYIEAAQCGLPVAYHEDGGGIVELASRFGLGYRASVVEAVRALPDRYVELRRQVLEQAPSGDLMCFEYRKLLQRLLASRVSVAAATQ
jgi:glycosyltransferase involved in cell wall biosynthesis